MERRNFLNWIFPFKLLTKFGIWFNKERLDFSLFVW